MESVTGKFFEAVLVFRLEIYFEFIEFFSSIVLLFLSSLVLHSFCSIVNVYDVVNDLIRVFLSLNILLFLLLRVIGGSVFFINNKIAVAI